MPRELITIQVGQCGNQVGCRFWDLALREHVAHNKDGVFDEALSSFFRNVDTRYDDPPDIPVGAGTSKISTLKARAIMVDMEEGVVNQLLKGPLADIFDNRQFITDVSGSGNNWAHGHEVYGPQYRDQLVDRVRRAAQFCDSLQCFSLIHSMGGGTGSGVGTYLLQVLEDEFPDVYRFSTVVFPSAEDDVITSPYNSVLAASELVHHADCVLPVENQALADLCVRAQKPLPSNQQRKSSITENAVPATEQKAKPFDDMNNIVAHLLTNLTCSMRFEGALNVDLNEITTNLVPFPRLHFLVSSINPLFTLADLKYRSNRIDQMFSDGFHRDYQLLRTNPKSNRYLACALLLRGDVHISDIHRNVARIKPQVDMVYWNPDGFKTGLCSVAPVGQPYSMLCLSNNCCMADVLQELCSRFRHLYKRKAHVHHYTQYMEVSQFDESLNTLVDLIGEYETLRNATPPAHAQRLVDRFVQLS